MPKANLGAVARRHADNRIDAVAVNDVGHQQQKGVLVAAKLAERPGEATKGGGDDPRRRSRFEIAGSVWLRHGPKERN